ncbi:MAG: Crossover junction endodeoxyribonuclease RusA [Alphaproteobacteria bacterium ADurb.BinA280]|nr:MAG: Crossover junction endodeoxyribonuclease RusA [Alphaproteobacteria bacterium ADurb.BinA280]
MQIDLPWPPSVNHYWRHLSRGKLAGRTLISEQGREYRDEVAHAVLSQIGNRTLPLNGRLKVWIRAYPPDRRRRDIDNLPKAIFDSLTHARVWPDDSNIDWMLIERCEVCSGGRISIAISKIEVEP